MSIGPAREGYCNKHRLYRKPCAMCAAQPMTPPPSEPTTGEKIERRWFENSGYPPTRLSILIDAALAEVTRERHTLVETLAARSKAWEDAERRLDELHVRVHDIDQQWDEKYRDAELRLKEVHDAWAEEVSALRAEKDSALASQEARHRSALEEVQRAKEGSDRLAAQYITRCARALTDLQAAEQREREAVAREKMLREALKSIMNDDGSSASLPAYDTRCVLAVAAIRSGDPQTRIDAKRAEIKARQKKS